MAVTQGDQRTAGFVVLTFVFRREGLTWTGECQELGTATYGRSLPKVRDELAELVTLHLDTLEQTGERAKFFKEHGIHVCYEEVIPATIEAELPLDEASFVHAHRVLLSA